MAEDKRERAAVSALLWEALANCEDLAAAAKSEKKTAYAGQQRAIKVVVGEFDIGGDGTHCASLFVDLVTGRQIIAAVEHIIKQRMVDLGQLDRPRSSANRQHGAREPMAAEDKTSDIVERLRDVGCDREPFTPDHAACVCRLTNEAASTITSLRSELDDLRHDIERHIKIASEAVTELDAHRDCVQALRLLRKNIQQGVSHPGYSEWLVQPADAGLSRLESPSGEGYAQRSVLNESPDGFEFYYGFTPGDRRQINVRFEGPDWAAYVGGVPIGRYESKAEAEVEAVAYINANPQPQRDDE